MNVMILNPRLKAPEREGLAHSETEHKPLAACEAEARQTNQGSAEASPHPTGLREHLSAPKSLSHKHSLVPDTQESLQATY